MITLKKQHRGYERYKKSRAEWLLENPETWNEKRLKFAVRIIGGNGFPDKFQGLESGKYPFYKVSDINKNGATISHANNYVSKSIVSEQNWKIVPPASIITGKIGEALKMNHRKITESECLIDNNMLGMHPSKDLSIGYFYYISKIIDLGWFTHPGTVPSVDMTQLKECWLPLPHLYEQSSIASYLDSKCALIDRIIGGKKKQIEMLQEQRAAIINQAVTKGLGEMVEMRESGVEWIGKIPKNWKSMPLKRVVAIKITDGPHTTPEFVENGVPFISVESIKDCKIDFESKRGDISKELDNEYSKKCKPKRDDIFIVKSGSTTGKIAMVDTDVDFNIWSPLALVRLNKEKTLSVFMFYLMQSKYFHRQIELSWTFGTQPNIGMGQIERLIVLLPSSVEEQLEIVQYLQKELKRTEIIMNAVNRSIAFLTEYKTSLISHIVTGKVKVS